MEVIWCVFITKPFGTGFAVSVSLCWCGSTSHPLVQALPVILAQLTSHWKAHVIQHSPADVKWHLSVVVWCTARIPSSCPLSHFHSSVSSSFPAFLPKSKGPLQISSLSLSLYLIHVFPNHVAHFQPQGLSCVSCFPCRFNENFPQIQSKLRHHSLYVSLRTMVSKCVTFLSLAKLVWLF